MSTASVTIKVGGRSQRFALSEGELATVGRSATCAIRVRDQSISREHCVAIYANGKVRVSDLASTHGILHQGQRVDQCDLLPGDGCRLGSAHFFFEAVSAGNGPEAKATRSDATRSVARDVAPPPDAATPAPVEDPASDASPRAPAIVEPESPAVEIAGYQIHEPLGAGGFGVVYRAQHVRLGREVALKILKHDSEAADAQAEIDAFEREARAAASINDPRLVQVFDVGHDNGQHFFSMEFVSGGSLARKLRRHGPMSWQEALPLIRDIALALRAAHAANLVHRDVKPTNILLTSEGRAKLTDLGLASGLVDAGTAAFMAPEQFLRREIDERTDIYALGCTAYAMLAARAPFSGSNKEIARAHVKEPPESFQRLGIQVPWHLDQLISESMMAKDPADRPSNAIELLERIDRLILPGTDLRPQRPPRTGARGGQPAPGRAAGRGNKALLARLLSELIVFSLIAAIVLVTLLALKYGWPELDIYRLIGK